MSKNQKKPRQIDLFKTEPAQPPAPEPAQPPAETKPAQPPAETKPENQKPAGNHPRFYAIG